MNKDIPAFPNAGLAELPNGEFDYGHPGMTLRQYYIAHAPAEPQPWFKPDMSPKPASGPWKGRSGRTYTTEDAAKSKEGEWGYYDEASEARAQWEKDKEKQRYIQWPAAWADAVLDAGN